MNAITNIFIAIIKRATTERKSVNDITEKVISGKMKRSEMDIIARGGPGVSKVTKRRYRKAKRTLERRTSL